MNELNAKILVPLTCSLRLSDSMRVRVRSFIPIPFPYALNDGAFNRKSRNKFLYLINDVRYNDNSL